VCACRCVYRPGQRLQRHDLLVHPGDVTFPHRPQRIVCARSIVTNSLHSPQRGPKYLTANADGFFVRLTCCSCRHPRDLRRTGWPFSLPNSGYGICLWFTLSSLFRLAISMLCPSEVGNAHAQLFCKSEQIKDVPVHATVGFRSVSRAPSLSVHERLGAGKTTALLASCSVRGLERRDRA
jgi:hypothetical protein